MTRSDIVKLIAQEKETLSVKEIDKIVDLLLEKMSEVLLDGSRIELRKFGVFAPKYLAPKLISTPKSKGKVQLPSRISVKFKTSKHLLDKINSK